MADLSTKYLGLALRNPIIVGSSELTNSPDKVADWERAGAGAVVLKSLFEEDINQEYRDMMREALRRGAHFEGVDYLDQQVRDSNLGRYQELISESKKRVSIPVIASVNCTYSYEWAAYARELQAAGADALELNMFFLPSDFKRTREEQEKAYFEVIERVRKQVTVPVALKISPYFADLGPMIQRLAQTGVQGLVLFNRFWSPDFDIERLRVVPTNVLSHDTEYVLPLRWVAIMAGRVNADLAASTGIHDTSALIKQLLAGAKAVQMVSALYRTGPSLIRTMLSELDDWMTTHGYFGVDHFRGMMSQAEADDPAIYERMQFLRHFAGKQQA